MNLLLLALGLAALLDTTTPDGLERSDDDEELVLRLRLDDRKAPSARRPRAAATS